MVGYGDSMKKKMWFQQNSGFTLIELIVSILVSSVVILSAVLFLSVCLNNYRDTAQETDLMMESQIAVNMIREVVMEAGELIETGEFVTGSFAYSYFAVKTERGLNDNGISDAGYYHLFVHDKQGAYLLYYREEGDGQASAQEWILGTLLADGKVDKDDLRQYFLADYVQKAVLEVTNPQLPILTMEFDCGGRIYRTEEIIRVRNTLPDER